MTALAERAVLVTGANRGMGREYVGQLLDRGARKVYAAARDPRTIDIDDSRVVPLQLDVTDAASVAAAVEAAADVTVLINNVGAATREVWSATDCMRQTPRGVQVVWVKQPRLRAVRAVADR